MSNIESPLVKPVVYRSENYSWIGYIFLGVVIVLAFASFVYYRRRKQRENYSLLYSRQIPSRDAIRLRRAINNFQARSYGGSISISSANRSSVSNSQIPTPVPIIYHEIMDVIERVFPQKYDSFYLSDSDNPNSKISLVQDRAWAFIYGCQSFYKPSGEPDFERHGKISEEIFLQLSDLEKIQLFQLRGIMASALTAIRMKIVAKGKEVNQNTMTNLTKGYYVEDHRLFALTYFDIHMLVLKQFSLQQLQTILDNLTLLKPAETVGKSGGDSSDSKSDGRDIIGIKLKINRLAAGIFLKDQNEDEMHAKIQQRILEVRMSLETVMKTEDYIPSERVSALFDGMID